MAKAIEVPKYRFGTEDIEVLEYYLYEVSIYKIYKDRVETIGNKFYKTDNYIKVKSAHKKYKDYILAKFVNLIGAPIDFINTYNLKLVEKNAKRRSKTSKSK